MKRLDRHLQSIINFGAIVEIGSHSVVTRYSSERISAGTSRNNFWNIKYIFKKIRHDLQTRALMRDQDIFLFGLNVLDKNLMFQLWSLIISILQNHSNHTCWFVITWTPSLGTDLAELILLKFKNCYRTSKKWIGIYGRSVNDLLKIAKARLTM